MAATQTADVIIVGAGPVGLFLACELALQNTSVLVLEREASPDSVWKLKPLGLRGLYPTSVEAFYRRGLLEKVFAGRLPQPFKKSEGVQSVGHFAGLTLDGNKADFSRWKYFLPGPASSGGPIFLAELERVLTERAVDLGVQIQRGTAVSKLVDDGKSVKVWADEQLFQAQ